MPQFTRLSLGVLLVVSGPLAGCAPAGPGPMAISEPAAPAMIAPGADQSNAVGIPEFPSLSPDGKFVVFAWAGDLWGTSIEGGVASRLTANPADERRSAFSPDGSQLAFESNRDGARNLYLMPITRTQAGLVGGTPRRITASDRAQTLAGFTSDGQGLLFAGSVDPTMYRSPRIYRVAINGPTDPTESGGVTGGPAELFSPVFGTIGRMSPDGSSVVFYRGYAPLDRPKYRGPGAGQLWRLNTADNAVTRLTTGEANNFEPWPLNDGSTVFVSSRDGQNNVWRLGPKGDSGQAAVQLTSFAPTKEQTTIGHGVRDLAVSGDGKTAVFVVWDQMYRLNLDAPAGPASQPQAIGVVAPADDRVPSVQRLSVDREVSEAALSPDGKSIAVAARGEIFVRSTTEGHPTRRVTNTVGRERDLAWSPDGRVLYFSSDDEGLAALGGNGAAGGRNNLGKYAIYAASVSMAREDLAQDKKDKPEGDAKKDDKPEAKDTPKADDKPTAKDDAKPEGDKLKPAAAPASKLKQPDFGKRWSESLRFEIEPVASDTTDLRNANPSPDGRALLVTRGLGDLVLINLESGARRDLFKSWDESEVQWASDARHIVYSVSDLDFNADIWLMDTGGIESFDSGFTQKPAVNLTRHPDLDSSPRLSPDGKVLTFLSQRGEQDDQLDVYQLFLDRELEGMTVYERDDYFKKAAEAHAKRKPAATPEFILKKLLAAKHPSMKGDKSGEAEKKDDAAKPAGEEPKKDAKAKKPEGLKFDAEDAYLRIRRITTSPGSKGSLLASSDRIVYSASVDGEPSLLSVDQKNADRKVIQAGAVGGVSMSITGERLAFIRTGTASTAPTKGGKVDAMAIDAPIMIDVAGQQRQKFLEAARTFGDRFYHPTLKGLDWPALTQRYVELASKTRTSESFNRICDALFGEVDGSHTGASGGASSAGTPTTTGYLGVRVKPVAGGYEVTDVTPDSPASQKNSKLNVGDVILSVDGRALAVDAQTKPMLDLDAALMGRAGRETLLEVRRAPKPAGEKPGEAQGTNPGESFVIIVPTSSGNWTALRYRQDSQLRREMVDKLSGGRLGYLHIRGMGEPEVRDYERDLFAAASGKDGLIIDVRDNGGGWTADILLASLTAPRHAYTAPRGVDLASVPQDAYPRDRRLIYAWTRPINVLINQHSFSNAEIFAHAIKTTGRGRLIGTRTFGGVISTGAFSLIDGTNIRMPFRGWYLPDGADMENNGAKPDVDVPQTPMDELSGRDSQLEAAVKDLLERLPKNAASK